MQFLDDLRKKSPEVKVYYGFAFAGTITGIIALVWVSTVPARFSKEAKISEDTPGIMDTFFAENGEQLANVIETIPKNPSELNELAGTEVIDVQNTETAPVAEQIPATPPTNSALGRLGGGETQEMPLSVTQEYGGAAEQNILPKPATSTLPLGATTESVVAEEKVPSEPTPPSITGQKPVLIEIKPVSKKPILIGTSTVQKSE